jgi:hypothetical protein
MMLPMDELSARRRIKYAMVPTMAMTKPLTLTGPFLSRGQALARFPNKGLNVESCPTSECRCGFAVGSFST